MCDLLAIATQYYRYLVQLVLLVEMLIWYHTTTRYHGQLW